MIKRLFALIYVIIWLLITAVLFFPFTVIFGKDKTDELLYLNWFSEYATYLENKYL